MFSTTPLAISKWMFRISACTADEVSGSGGSARAAGSPAPGSVSAAPPRSDGPQMAAESAKRIAHLRLAKLLADNQISVLRRATRRRIPLMAR